ncbi:MAG: four helix bundle protein [Bacteroidota bacterium]
MKQENLILDKSFEFALDVIQLYNIHINQKEYVLSKQFLRSGTAIGALIEEAQGAHSKKDFIAKMEIAYKEARETKYWFRLLERSQLVKADYHLYIIKSDEILKLLTAIIRSSKQNYITEKTTITIK